MMRNFNRNLITTRDSRGQLKLITLHSGTIFPEING